jgi:hypothetical protein
VDGALETVGGVLGAADVDGALETVGGVLGAADKDGALETVGGVLGAADEDGAAEFVGEFVGEGVGKEVNSCLEWPGGFGFWRPGGVCQLFNDRGALLGSSPIFADAPLKIITRTIARAIRKLNDASSHLCILDCRDEDLNCEPAVAAVIVMFCFSFASSCDTGCTVWSEDPISSARCQNWWPLGMEFAFWIPSQRLRGTHVLELLMNRNERFDDNCMLGTKERWSCQKMRNVNIHGQCGLKLMVEKQNGRCLPVCFSASHLLCHLANHW